MRDFWIDNGRYCCNAAVAAAVCGVHPMTFSAWGKQANPPPYNANVRGYILTDLGEWCRKEQTLKATGRGSHQHFPDPVRAKQILGIPVQLMPGVQPISTGKKKSLDGVNQKDRLTSLQADKVELELKQKAGELIPAADVHQAWANVLSRVRTLMLSVPSSLAPDLVDLTAVEIEEELARQIRTTLEELSNDWRTEEVDESEFSDESS